LNFPTEVTRKSQQDLQSFMQTREFFSLLKT